MAERGLIAGDVLYLLRAGFVHDEAEETSMPELFKYFIEGKTPNAGGRTVGAVVVAGEVMNRLKILTVMRVDEK